MQIALFHKPCKLYSTRAAKWEFNCLHRLFYLKSQWRFYVDCAYHLRIQLKPLIHGFHCAYHLRIPLKLRTFMVSKQLNSHLARVEYNLHGLWNNAICTTYGIEIMNLHELYGFHTMRVTSAWFGNHVIWLISWYRNNFSLFSWFIVQFILFETKFMVWI